MREIKSNLHQLKAGVIGTGFIGPVHMEALRRLGVQVVALCDVAKGAEAVAKRFGVPQFFADHVTMLAQSGVDVVHIASPNRFHHRMALDVLRAGKHCICEKPLAMNSRETAEIVKTAAKSKTVFAVNYNIRFYPAVLQLRALAEKGVLGELIHVNGSYFQDWLCKQTDYNWRLLPAEGGKLRAVADIGTHWMDAVCFIMGCPIKSVLADLFTYHTQRLRPLGEVQTYTKAASHLKYAPYPVQTEDYASILLQFANGARGNLAVSQVAAGRKNCLRIELYGSKKSAWWDSENPNSIHFGNRDGWNETALRNTPGFSADLAGFTDYPNGHNEGFPDTFKMNFRCIYNAILEDRNPRWFANAQDGHQEVKVCEAIQKSHQAKAWVKV